MPIVNHDLRKNQLAGLMSAHFNVSGTDDTDIELPLSGPKQIRRIVVTTGANSGAVGTLTLQPKQTTGGNTLGSARDIKKAAGTYVKWDEATLTSTAVRMDSTFDGIAFSVVNAGGADAWAFAVEVVYSPVTNVNGTAYVDAKLNGVL